LQRLNVIEGRRIGSHLAIPKEMSGRQKVRARKLLRRLAKVAQNAA
jgi:hypothetical protein